MAMSGTVSATVTPEIVNFNNENNFLLLKFSGQSKDLYRFVSRTMVASDLREAVGGCREEEVIIDRFGRTAFKEICRLSLKAPKQGISVESLKFIDLGDLVDPSKKEVFVDNLRNAIGKKNPIILNAGTVSTKGVRSCSNTNSNPSCGTRQVPAVVADKGFEKRAALMTKNRKVICTYNPQTNPAQFFQPETCLINISNAIDLNEEQLLSRYPKRTRVILLEDIKCSTKTNRVEGGSRPSRLYPNRIQLFIANIGRYAFEYGFSREFKNVTFSNKLQDLGVFCDVTKVSDLSNPRGNGARYENVIACDTSRLSKITSLSRIAKFDTRSCNFPLNNL